MKKLLTLLLMFSSCLHARESQQQAIQVIQNQKIRSTDFSNQKSWGEIFKQSHLAVFQIYAYTYEYNYMEPFKQPSQSAGCGTGFIAQIGDTKYMMTNFHVISQAKPECIFALHSTLPEERFDLEYIGGSPTLDIAILKFSETEEAKLKKLLNVKELVALEFVDSSDEVVSAQEAMCIGHPLGTQHVQTSIGYISGVSDGNSGKLLQTTAPVNPGNSGGPFLDRNGKVIGVCVAKGIDTEGIAFIIPERNVFNNIHELLNTKLCNPPFWGFEPTATLESTLQNLGNPTDGGVLVAQVYEGGLAQEVGIKKHDVIYALTDDTGTRKIDRNGYLFAPWSTNKVRLYDYLSRLEMDTNIVATIYRKGEKLEIPIQIKSKKRFAIDWHYPWIHEDLDYEILGGMVFSEFCINQIMTLQAISQYCELDLSLVKKYLDEANRHEPRVIMTMIYPTARLKHNTCFRNGDKIIKKVNGIKVKTIDDLREAVRAGIGEKYLTIQCEGGSFVCLPVKEMLEDEPYLAARYGFDISPLAHELAEGVAD